MISLAQIGKQIEVCESKYVFATRGLAIKFNARHGYANKPYRCPICGDWHLTKQGK